MPFRCIVHYCKGNYKNGPEIHVFSFPIDKTLSNIWMHTTKRMDFLLLNLAEWVFFVLKSK